MACPSDPVVQPQEVLHEGQLFESWPHFESALKMYKEATGTAWRVQSSNTTENVNKNKKLSLDVHKYPYYYAKFVCVHFGERKPKGTGERERPMALPCSCSASFTISYYSKKECYQLKKLNSIHEWHQPDVLLGPFYAINRRLDKDEQDEAFSFLAVQPNNGLLLDALRTSFGKNVQRRDLSNLRQKFKATNGDNNDLISVIKELQDVHGCSVEYAIGKENELEYLVFQTKYMRSILQLYPEILFIDSTYATNKLEMPLLQIMVKDCNGMGRPVGFAFLKRETQQHISSVLSIFREYQDQIKTVMVDKCWEEIDAIREVFPESAVLLCYFHAIVTFMEKIKELYRDRSEDEKERINTMAKSLVYSSSQEAFSECLTQLQEEAPELGDYIAANWLDIKPMWVKFFRHDLCTLGDDTNNRIESANGKLKDLLNRKCSLAECLSLLFIHNQNQEMDSAMKQADDLIKTLSLPGHLKGYAVLFNKMTSYAGKQLREQIKILQTCSYELHQVGGLLCVLHGSENHRLNLDQSSCSCSFYQNFLLPCRHLLFSAKELQYPLEKLHIPQRWQKRLPSHHVLQNQTYSAKSHEFPSIDARVLTAGEKFRRASLVSKSVCSYLSTVGTPQFLKYIEQFEQFESLLREGKKFTFSFEVQDTNQPMSPATANGCGMSSPPASVDQMENSDSLHDSSQNSRPRSPEEDDALSSSCLEPPSITAIIQPNSVGFSGSQCAELVSDMSHPRLLRSRLIRSRNVLAVNADQQKPTSPSLIPLKTAVLRNVKRRGRPRNITKSATSFMPKKKKAKK